MALHRVLRSKDFEIVCLLTTITDRFHRISMHGVREELLDAQAQSVGYPIEKVRIPYPCPNQVYEARMANFLSAWKSKGVRHVIFGDLFLENIRDYREQKLFQMDMTPIFPLWREDTGQLAREMLKVGFRAVVTCVDPKRIKPKFAGHFFDETFLRSIPPDVDPCGENGEFHTFVYDGPIFNQPISLKVGETITRDGFTFTDLEQYGSI